MNVQILLGTIVNVVIESEYSIVITFIDNRQVSITGFDDGLTVTEIEKNK